MSREHRRALWSLMVSMIGFSPIYAAPPTIADIRPRGIERGKPVEITVTGTNLLPKTQLHLPFAATVQAVAEAKPNPAQAKFRVTVPADVLGGIYPARVSTEDGVSALALLAVDVLANILEVEDNTSIDKAQNVPFPSAITGQCAGGDVDFYRFTVKKGQRVVVETEAVRLGSGVIPQIRVTDAKGRFIAADDSQKLRGDCRLWFVAPEDGAYVVEFSDTRYRGAAPPHYRLRIADYDFADEIFPLGSRLDGPGAFTLYGGNLPGPVSLTASLKLAPLAWANPLLRRLKMPDTLKPGMTPFDVVLSEHPDVVAQSIKDPRGLALAPPMTIHGRLAQKNAVAKFHFPVQEGQRWRFAVRAESLGSYLDAVLKIADQSGKQLALADDVDVPAVVAGQPATKAADPFLEYTVPKGVTALGVELRDARDRGGINFGYILTIEPARADFTLETTAGEINLPEGGAAALTVAVQRRGYTGPLQLSMPGLPPYLSVRGGYIPEGGSSGTLTIAQRDPKQKWEGLLPARVEGMPLDKEAKGFKVQALQKLILNKDEVAASTLFVGDLPTCLALAEPFTLTAPETLELVYGYPASAPVKLTWAAKEKPVAVEVNVLGAAPKPQPNALAVKPGAVAPGKHETSVSITAPAALKEGRGADLVLQGKAKINNKDVTVLSAAVTLTIKRPFELTVASDKLTLAPGQTTIIKGKIQPHALFKEQIQLKLDGLPKGLVPAAPLKPLSPGQRDFEIPLKVDAKLAPLAASVSVAASATINGVGYTHPALAVQVVVDKK